MVSKKRFWLRNLRRFWVCFLIGLFLFCVGLPGQILATLPPTQETTAALLSQAKVNYQQGNFTQAQTLWQILAQRFADRGDKLNQAMALSNLSLTAQQLGEWELAQRAIAEAQTILKETTEEAGQGLIQAQSLAVQGQLQVNQGQTQEALKTWQTTARLYEQLDNPSEAINSQISQAQAYQQLGMFPQACQTLLNLLDKTSTSCQVPPLLLAEPAELQSLFPASFTPALQLRWLQTLGNTLISLGKPLEAYAVLVPGVTLAQSEKSQAFLAALTLSLGNTARAIANQKVTDTERRFAVQLESSGDCLSNPNQGKSIKFYRQAGGCYRQAIATTQNPNLKLQAQTNLLTLALQVGSWKTLPDDLNALHQSLEQSFPNSTAIAARLKLAQGLLCLQETSSPVASNRLSSPLLQTCPKLTPETLTQIRQNAQLTHWLTPKAITAQLQTALNQAQTLQDPHLLGQTLGYLGAIAWEQGEALAARRYTEQASLQTSNRNAPEIAYLWQWQLGRILASQGDTLPAITAYQNAYTLLQSLRQALGGANTELQFAFRDRVEPVYRELVDLLLQSSRPEPEKLNQAREVIESLQIAELNNFFQESCLEGERPNLEQLDPKAALIYAITLPQRLAVILSIPHQPLQYFETVLNSSQDTLETTVNTLLKNTLNPRQKINLAPNQQLYQWLIKPLESALKQQPIETLVFVLDGVLRNVPLATLHDGQHYLLENYNTAVVPSLRLLPSRVNDSPIATNPNALIGGLVEARQGFDALPAVAQEVTKIQALLPAEVLLNQSFTANNLQTQLQNSNFPIVHLATHGQFASKAEDTFLLTWDERINVKNLDQILRETDNKNQAIELLILSACQTATGDNRAPLGLAGVAVRSGAKSTLATLWPVNDQSTAQLILQFYEILKNPQQSKAQAMRQAQLTLLKNSAYQHPYYWGPFILVGNWL